MEVIRQNSLYESDMKGGVMLSNKRRGVSLVELLVVIVIIVIMAGAIVAMMHSFSQRQALEISAANLLADLKQTQQFARAQRDIGDQCAGNYYSKYFGLRFYDSLGENGDRQGWKIVGYCDVDACGNCIGTVTLPITDTTAFKIVKSAQDLGGCTCLPVLSDNTIFAKGVSLDATSEFQINPTAPKLHSIIFTTEGSATKNGVDLLDDNTDEIKLNLNGKLKTIRIISLTGHVKIE